MGRVVLQLHGRYNVPLHHARGIRAGKVLTSLQHITLNMESVPVSHEFVDIQLDLVFRFGRKCCFFCYRCTTLFEKHYSNWLCRAHGLSQLVPLRICLSTPSVIHCIIYLPHDPCHVSAIMYFLSSTGIGWNWYVCFIVMGHVQWAKNILAHVHLFHVLSIDSRSHACQDL